MKATSRQSLRRYMVRIVVFCLVLAWVGCKSMTPYEQLELEKKKNEEMQMERERKSWFYQRYPEPSWPQSRSP